MVWNARGAGSKDETAVAGDAAVARFAQARGGTGAPPWNRTGAGKTRNSERRLGMRNRMPAGALLVFLLLASGFAIELKAGTTNGISAEHIPPLPQREFRGAWI